jgi:tRNA(Ile)-lysidine synthase
MKLRSTLQEFAERHQIESGDMLIAVSGGPDSMALYHACRALWGDSLSIVHVDHGWRPESGAQALELQCTLAGTFHLESCTPKSEDGARQARLAIYRKLCETHGYRGVLLAHHADDQAETVFKRVIEGASIASLGGMREVSVVDGVTLYRPFLTLSKEELASTGFDDSTNRDTRFQRARLRHEILPGLGRPVRRPLLRIAEESRELKEFLDERLASFPLESGPFGRWIDLSESEIHRLELRHLLRSLAPLSREQLTNACDLFEAGAIGAVGSITIDRRRLFLLQPQGSWELSVGEGEPCLGWENFLRGKLAARLPAGSYQVGPVDLTSFGKKMTAQKVPTLLRPHAPTLYRNEKSFFDFFTGVHSEKNDVSDCVTITLDWRPPAC